MSTPKLNPNDREKQILAEAVDQAARLGYQNINRQTIAAALSISPALINRYFGTMPNLRRDVMRAAVRGKNLAVIAQGLAMKDRHAMKAPEAVRVAALESIRA